jgi:two-component system chemotaxis response regulator CheY
MENENTAKSDGQGKVKKTILIVDDSATIREFSKSLLEDEYDVVTRNDGQEALDYLNQGNRPNLILSDMEMPNMNGRTFVRKVFSDPRYGKIPVIFITTVNSEMLINSFKDIGIADYIIKPFKPEELIGKVHSMFQ